MLIKSPEGEILTNSPKTVSEDEQLYQSAFGTTTKCPSQAAHQQNAFSSRFGRFKDMYPHWLVQKRGSWQRPKAKVDTCC